MPVSRWMNNVQGVGLKDCVMGGRFEFNGSSASTSAQISGDIASVTHSATGEYLVTFKVTGWQAFKSVQITAENADPTASLQIDVSSFNAANGTVTVGVHNGTTSVDIADAADTFCNVFVLARESSVDE